MGVKSLFVVLVSWLLVACQALESPPAGTPVSRSLLSLPPAKVIETAQADNSPWAQRQPYVLMISLDGFRWDYIDMYKPKFLSRFVTESASLEGLRPAYPSKTFPNHLTLVTGLYPQNHGIVANDFYQRKLQKRYRLKDRSAVRDGRFYNGLSIWGLAASQGMRSASYFWPGSEANSPAFQPSYYLPYDHHGDHMARVEQIVAWLKLPPAKRPHFINLYFHETDTAGHHYGPGSAELGATIAQLDKVLQTLVRRLDALALDLNIILVSDHGMTHTSAERRIALDLPPGYTSVGNGPVVQLYPEAYRSGDFEQAAPRPEEALAQLNQSAQHYRCYRPEQAPAPLKIARAEGLGAIVCLADMGWSLIASGKKRRALSPGNHGWSPHQGRDMHGIFYARGPAFKPGYVHPRQDNIHVYPLLAHILGLELSQPIDGQLAPMRPLLK